MIFCVCIKKTQDFAPTMAKKLAEKVRSVSLGFFSKMNNYCDTK